MTKLFLIAVEGLDKEFWVESDTAKETKNHLWRNVLDDWQRDNTESMEVIDIKEL